REAVAEVLGVPLERDPAVAARVEEHFARRERRMPDNNLRQADVPRGATVIEQVRGTAPGLVCPNGSQVIYVLPGVPHEMMEMAGRAVLPDIARRQAEAGQDGVVLSRVLRTWGVGESTLAETLRGRVAAHEAGTERGAGSSESGTKRAAGVTIAFLASGVEGMKVRLTTRARDREAALALLDAEEQEIRRVLAGVHGDIVFGVDDVNMERAVAALLVGRGLTLGIAESLTGGLLASRLVDVAGASAWFRGCVVAYDPAVKRDVLGVPAGPVVTAEAAVAMAAGARRVLGADIGLALTGVAGPASQEGITPGTVLVGLVLADGETSARELRLPGDRQSVRWYAAISALDILRRALGEGGDRVRR
ncbi:MAG: nicotinamide-nucleotide amidohydrolase family protein, partial [Solirubrobacteraceae bacterium]